MFNTNLVLPLLALGMYSHCHNINLANNTSLLIIVLALALQQREINKINCDNGTNGDTTVYRSTTYNHGTARTTYTTSTGNCPYAAAGYTPFPYAVNYTNGNCGCPNGYAYPNTSWQTFTAPCGNSGCVVC